VDGFADSTTTPAHHPQDGHPERSAEGAQSKDLNDFISTEAARLFPTTGSWCVVWVFIFLLG
jgi:hypothetical protein